MGIQHSREARARADGRVSQPRGSDGDAVPDDWWSVVVAPVLRGYARAMFLGALNIAIAAAMSLRLASSPARARRRQRELA
jgi:hypothetical protein